MCNQGPYIYIRFLWSGGSMQIGQIHIQMHSPGNCKYVTILLREQACAWAQSMWRILSLALNLRRVCHVAQMWEFSDFFRSWSKNPSNWSCSTAIPVLLSQFMTDAVMAAFVYLFLKFITHFPAETPKPQLRWQAPRIPDNSVKSASGDFGWLLTACSTTAPSSSPCHPVKLKPGCCKAALIVPGATRTSCLLLLLLCKCSIMGYIALCFYIVFLLYFIMSYSTLRWNTNLFIYFFKKYILLFSPQKRIQGSSQRQEQ